MPEEWREIGDYPGFQISSLGRVMKPDGTIQVGSFNAQGYKQFMITLAPRVYKAIHAHKEVCKAFHGPKPFLEAQALHKNGDKRDNTVSNVYWGTHTQNMEDRDRHKTTARGESAGLAKLTREQVREIRRLHNEKAVSRTTLCKRFGIARSTLQSILSNKTWSE